MHKIGLRRLNALSAKYRELLLEDIESGKILTESVQQCACCGNDNLEKIIEIDRFNLPFGSHICTNCGLITTSPRIKNESLPYYYDKYYHVLNYGKESLETQAALFNPRQGVKVYERLKPFVKKESVNILEIGAGVGDVLSGVRSGMEQSGITANVFGTEYSNECIHKCRSIGIETIQGDAETVVKLKKKFDIIILSHVFEHMIDLKVELDRLKALLNEDGVIYIEVPGIYETHLKAYYDFSFLGYSVHAHMYNFSLETLERVVTQSGFVLLEGGEEAYGVFAVGDGDLKEHESQYSKVSHYLEFLEKNQEFAISQRDMISKQARALDSEKSSVIKLESEISQFKSEILGLESEILGLESELSKLGSENFRLESELGKSLSFLSKIKSAKQNLASYHEARPFFRRKRKAYLDLLRAIDATKD